MRFPDSNTRSSYAYYEWWYIELLVKGELEMVDGFVLVKKAKVIS
jgi:hypothetical protein